MLSELMMPVEWQFVCPYTSITCFGFHFLVASIQNLSHLIKLISFVINLTILFVP